MKKIFNQLVGFYDHIHRIWEAESTHRFLSSVLVFSFLASFLLIALSYWGLIPDNLKRFIPANAFQAIQVSFTLVLILEVISLVFSISYSVTSSLVKQLEILSLILLRSTFKQFGEFHELENWDHWDPILSMLADAFGALIIFVIILLINRSLKHIPITDDPSRQSRFIKFKKLTGLVIFGIFLFTGAYDIGLYVMQEQPFQFFKTFYTVLIFTDIFLVLLSMRYNYSYIIVFRNSAFAVATLLIRMALSAPNYYNIALGTLASLFVLSISYFYTKYRDYQPEEGSFKA